MQSPGLRAAWIRYSGCGFPKIYVWTNFPGPLEHWVFEINSSQLLIMLTWGIVWNPGAQISLTSKLGSLEVGPRHLCFLKLHEWLQCAAQVEGYCRPSAKPECPTARPRLSLSLSLFPTKVSWILKTNTRNSSSTKAFIEHPQLNSWTLRTSSISILRIEFASTGTITVAASATLTQLSGPMIPTECLASESYSVPGPWRNSIFCDFGVSLSNFLIIRLDIRIATL